MVGARLRRVRVRRFELRLIAIALLVAWSVAAVLILFAYRPGGPLDILVGLAALGPIVIATLGVVWPPLPRGAGAFPLMVCLGLGTLLLLLPSIAGIFRQLAGLGSQTLLPSLEASYPWLLALLGTSLFSGFGIARRILGGTAMRRRRLILGIALGSGMTLLAGITFTTVALANEFALRDRPGSATGSRFGPTALAGIPPLCDEPLATAASARIATHLSGTIDLRPAGTVEQGGIRNGEAFRWMAYVASDRQLGWYGATLIDGRAWARSPGGGWVDASTEQVADGAVDLQAIESALTPGYRATAEDRGIEIIEGAPARRCRVAVDGAVFTTAFPQVRWLFGPADLDDWRGQLDFWIFLDGGIGRIAGSLNGEGSVIDPGALQGTVDVLLTATERGRDFVIYPPAR